MAVSCRNLLLGGQLRLRSACACAQSNQNPEDRFSQGVVHINSTPFLVTDLFLNFGDLRIIDEVRLAESS